MAAPRFDRSIVLVLAAAVIIVAAIAAPAAQSLPEGAVTVPGMSAPFSSNGCSGFREAQFFSCCFAHDFAFWAGGNWTDRRAADKRLRRCVIDVGKDRLRGDIAFLLIRLGIVPGVVVNDGWARAWTGTPRHRFSALTTDQKLIVADEKQRVCQAMTVNPATGNYTIAPRHLRTEPRELRAAQAREFCGFSPPAR